MSVQITESKHRFEKLNGEYYANGFLMYYFYGRDYMIKIPDFPLDPRDLLLATFPRSGTTFTQRIICGLRHGAEAISTESYNLFQEFPHLDLNFPNQYYLGYDLALTKEVPRYVKTHVPLSIAPKSIHNNGKVIFVIRNPRDTMVSLFNFHKNDSTLDFNYDFATYFQMFLEGCVMNGDWCRYNSEWLQFCREHPNRCLVLTYEQLLTDFETHARKLATFLNLPDVTDDLILRVKQETNVEKMRKTTVCEGLKDFVRKGISGDWKNYFTSEQSKRFEEWIEEKKKVYAKDLFELVGE